MGDVKKDMDDSKSEAQSANENGEQDSTLDVSAVTDAGEDTEDPVVTLDEVIAEEKELMENAHEVLAGSDDKNCSYPQVQYVVHF
jgi:hypothetical protein